jgi:hypothetical protein
MSYRAGIYYPWYVNFSVEFWRGVDVFGTKSVSLNIHTYIHICILYLYCHVLSDYRRGLDWELHLLDHSVHFTIHCSALHCLPSAESLLGWAQDLLQTQLSTNSLVSEWVSEWMNELRPTVSRSWCRAQIDQILITIWLLLFFFSMSGAPSDLLQYSSVNLLLALASILSNSPYL